MTEEKTKHTLVCPWWLLFTFDNPLRRWIQNPQKVLNGYITLGQTVLDVGCGMGYFSVPMARMVGPQGKVFAADLQERMLAGLHQRAEKAGVLSRIEITHSTPESIGISKPIQFALAFWMVHEVPNKKPFLQQIYDALLAGGKFLIVEPAIHVSRRNFTETQQVCSHLGFKQVKLTRPLLSWFLLLEK